MKWSKDNSIKLSLICICIFAVILLALDVFAFKLIPWFISTRSGFGYKSLYFYLTVYSGSIFAWICLWCLYVLLTNIQSESVFTQENVKLMRTISWCCAGASLIGLISTFYYVPFFLVAVCAAFMMLIVRIVKNVFQQSINMKSELDLTI